MKRRICKICGKEFDFWHSQAKTCGKECSRIYAKQLKILYTKNNYQKVKESRIKSYYKHRKLKRKKCKICGNFFYLRGAKAKTCSNECKKENIRRYTNRNSRLWVKRNPEKRSEISRRYSLKNREKLKIKNKEWRKKNPHKVIESTNRWRKKNKTKRNAQALAQYHITIPLNSLCEICNKEKATHRHHTDYFKPREVKFLCARCHINLHNKRGKKG